LLAPRRIQFGAEQAASGARRLFAARGILNLLPHFVFGLTLIPSSRTNIIRNR
jgi:hypothetical protein